MIFPQITSPPQAQAEVIVNENFDALEHQGVYAKAFLTTSGLTWGYLGGRWGGFSITAGTLTLTNSAANYIVVSIATGVISVSTSTTNWNSATSYVRVYKVTTAGGVVSAIEDHRAGPNGVHGGGNGIGSVLKAHSVFVDAVYGNDSTGALDDFGKPFLTINAALDALIAAGPVGSTVFLSRGRFAPITDDYQGSTTPDPASNLFSGLSIIGSGQPALDNATAPTTLDASTGTVIDGPLVFDSARSYITLRDLGVDSGSAVCTARYSGTAQEGLLVSNIPQSTARLSRGWHVENVISLCKTASSAVHACLMEDLWEPYGNNIEAYFGTHGFVDKAYRARWSNIVSKGHSTDCFGFSYNTYAHTDQAAMSNLIAGELGSSDTPTALWFKTTTSSTMQRIVISGLQCYNIATQELLFQEDSTGGTSNVIIDGLQTTNGTIRVTTATHTDAATISINDSGPKVIQIAASDESTALTSGTGKMTFRMPHKFQLTAVRASLVTAQTSGSIFTVDINEAGTSVLSTKLTIDNTEKTSTTAATPAVISDSSIADDAEITIDIDQVGDGTAKGLKVALIGMQW